MKSPVTHRRRLLRTLVLLSLVNGLILLLVGLRYVQYASWPDASMAGVLFVCLYVGHLALLGALPALVLLPLALLLPRPRLILSGYVLLAAAQQALFQLDSLVFAENQFHLNGLTLAILAWPSWLFTAGFAVVMLLFQSILIRRLWPRCQRPLPKAVGALCAVLVISLISGQLLYAWADANYDSQGTRIARYLPLFNGLTAKRFMHRHGLVDTEQVRQRQQLSLTNDGSQQLNYPIAPLQCQTPSRPHNILLITVDAMRFDMLNPINAPSIYRHSQQALVFTDHYSGGNSSRMGLFSMFYGLPANYWSAFYDEQRPPVLTQQLKQAGYQFGIFASSSLTRPSGMDRTAFAGISNIPTYKHLSRPWLRDKQLVADWDAFLAQRDPERPFFGFLFFDSPTNNSYPKDYPEPAQPMIAQNPAQAERFTSYQRALHFADALVADAMSVLNKHQLLDDTLVIFTSDHGQEFDENRLGFKSHGSSFSDWQLKVPLVMLWPGKTPEVITRRTAHRDLAPTLLSDVLGCAADPGLYSTGRSLFEPTSWPYVIAGSYHNMAVVEPRQITVSYPGGYFEVRAKEDYQPLGIRQVNRELLSDALVQMRRFYHNGPAHDGRDHNGRDD